jgi:hypothetical protein
MINGEEQKKFQVTIQFVMDEDFMSFIPKHREHINQLIEKEIIDQYLVSMESQTVWITLTALDKEEALQLLQKSALYPYFRKIRIETLFLVDGLHYRFPALQPN